MRSRRKFADDTLMWSESRKQMEVSSGRRKVGRKRIHKKELSDLWYSLRVGFVFVFNLYLYMQPH